MISIPKTDSARMRYESPTPAIAIRCCSASPPEKGGAASWEQSLLHLSESLNSICGGSADRPRHVSAPSANRSVSQPPPPLSQCMRAVTRALSNGHDDCVHVTCPGGRQSVHVKHEESASNLSLRLADICRSRAAAAATVSRVTPAAAHAPRRTAYRLVIDTGSRPADDVTVSVTGRTLRACAITERPGVLCESDVPSHVAVDRLLCYAQADGSLVVSEDEQGIVHANLPPATQLFCPIVVETNNDDDDSARFTLILRLPPQHAAACVKTVDDHVIVSERDGSASPGNAPTSPLYVIALPEIVNTRSVAAVLTSHHQLIITATAAAQFRSRSHTF